MPPYHNPCPLAEIKNIFHHPGQFSFPYSPFCIIHTHIVRTVNQPLERSRFQGVCILTGPRSYLRARMSYDSELFMSG
jgi:hypothetical protein